MERKAKTRKKGTPRSRRRTAARKPSGHARRTATRRASRAKKPKLPHALRYANWIQSPEEHEDRPGETLVTCNPDVIRRWGAERGARPATAGRRSPDEPPRILRLDFPGFGGEGLEHISWDEWMRTFEDRELLFVFQEHKADGTPSNFFRLDNPAQ